MTSSTLAPGPNGHAEQEAASDEAKRLTAAAALIQAFLSDPDVHDASAWDVQPTRYPAGKAICNAEPDRRAAAVVVGIYLHANELRVSPCGHNAIVLRSLLLALLRRATPFRDSDLDAIFELLAGIPRLWAGDLPVLQLAKAIELHVAEHPLPTASHEALNELIASAEHEAVYADQKKGLDIFRRLAADHGRVAIPIDAVDDWGAYAVERMARLDDVEAKVWVGVIKHAAAANGPLPSTRWLKGARDVVSSVGAETVAAMASELLQLMGRPVSRSTARHPFEPRKSSATLTDRNGTILKGLAWLCALLEDHAPVRALGDAAIACFARIPGIGARSVKAGNACIYALGELPELMGVPQLVRLQQRVTHTQARGLINGTLEGVARRAGLTTDDLADITTPTFGLVDGRVQRSFGSFSAEIALVPGNRVEIAWSDAAGKPRKSVPAEVKRDHAEELKTFKQLANELDGMLSAQRTRIERFLMTDRTWSYANWRERILNHPLLAYFSRRLIWEVSSGEGWTIAGWLQGKLVDRDDVPLLEPEPEARVRLYHPVRVDSGTARVWRTWLERHRVTQPFKQAHREIYRVTDAERESGTRSARFAGHILKQHQFAALCKHRGWRYTLQGSFDKPHETPTLRLPDPHLSVSFSAEMIDSPDGYSPEFIALYVSTGHVVFRRTIWPNVEDVPLEQIEPALFSEVMRDVDLFVGVCSIGADPEWPIRHERQHVEYWSGVAFGELNEAANGRRELLERIIPTLTIAPRCQLLDRTLVVRGDIRTYSIHLGSGNIQMEPNNEYLCIVPKPGPPVVGESGRIYLPFEGDVILSMILSKAFLLANDTAITDPVILRQIGNVAAGTHPAA